MKIKVGDLAYPNKAMRDLNYPKVGIVIAIEGGIFHPSWLENHPRGIKYK
jgi:hypothetical protein